MCASGGGKMSDGGEGGRAIAGSCRDTPRGIYCICTFPSSSSCITISSPTAY